MEATISIVPEGRLRALAAPLGVAVSIGSSASVGAPPRPSNDAAGAVTPIRAAGPVDLGATDRELMVAATAGDVAAFDALIRLHQDFLFAIAAWATHDTELAEDGLQDGLLLAFRHANLYRSEGPVRAWLARIVLNACRDRQRWQRRRPLPSLWADARLGDAPARAGDPHRALVERERGRLLEEAIRRLTVDQRVALLLFAVHGVPYEEIAVATGAPIGTVKSRIHRARLALRELLASHRDLFLEA